MSPWQKTQIGRRLLNAFDDIISVFIVIHDKLVFQELINLNQATTRSNRLSPCLFRWLGDEEENDGEADTQSVSTVNEQSESEFGVIGLRLPMFIHEKRRASLPACFLFSRKSAHRKVDIHLGDSRTRNISRIHFALGMDRDHWFIRGLGGNLKVLRIAELGPASPSFVLHPENFNSLLVGDIQLDLYCGIRSQISHCLRDIAEPSGQRELLSEIETSSCASLTTIDAAKIPSPSFGDYFHFLQHPRIRNRTSIDNIDKLLALDAWSCNLYVAKLYPTPDASARHETLSKLQARLKLLRKIPNDEKFIIRDERLYKPEDPKAVYLMTLYSECISPLAESLTKPQMRVALARAILRRLIRTIARLHQCGITHGDICTRTVLVDDGDNAFVYLSGFSNASENVNRAKNDCLAILQTVQEYLKPASSLLPEFWIGHDGLDKIWKSFVKGDYNQIPTVEDTVEILEIDLSQSAELWTTMRAFKDMEVKHLRNQDVIYLDVIDVKEYLLQDAGCCAQEGASFLDVARLAEKACTAIDSCAWEGKITLDDYDSFVHHMQKAHNSSISETLNWALGPELQKADNSLLRFALSARVPYNIQYGLINIEFLRGLVSSAVDPQVLQQFIPQCLELRGSPKHSGVYIPTSVFGDVANAINLRFDPRELHDAQDSSMWKFTYHKWFLIASNESSDLYPVDRTTSTVHLNSIPDMPLSQFLPRYFAKGTYLDSQVARDPEQLLAPVDKTELSHSCGGSVPPDPELDIRNALSKKPRLSNIRATKRQLRTEEWVANSQTGKRQATIR